MIRSIIVEDDPGHAARLERLLGNHGEGVEIMEICGDIETAAAAISRFSPELVFLDIELDAGTGFDLLKKIEDVNFDVIFTTNHINRYIRDIRICGLTYLPKPIDSSELAEALQKFKNKNGYGTRKEQVLSLKENLSTENPGHRSIWINNSKNNYVPVEARNIVYCTSKNQYTHFFIQEDNIEKLAIMHELGLNKEPDGTVRWVSSNGIGEWEDTLEHYGFCRVHNSTIVNLLHVLRYTKEDGDMLHLSCGANVPMSRERKKKFLALAGLR